MATGSGFSDCPMHDGSLGTAECMLNVLFTYSIHVLNGGLQSIIQAYMGIYVNRLIGITLSVLTLIQSILGTIHYHLICVALEHCTPTEHRTLSGIIRSLKTTLALLCIIEKPHDLGCIFSLFNVILHI